MQSNFTGFRESNIKLYVEWKTKALNPIRWGTLNNLFIKVGGEVRGQSLPSYPVNQFLLDLELIWIYDPKGISEFKI